MTRFFKIVGFDSFNDLIGTHSVFIMKQIFMVSFLFSWIFAIIENALGINYEYLQLFIVGNVFDLTFGIFINIFWLKHKFDSSKGFRGVTKVFIVFSIMYFTNKLRLSFTHVNETHEMLGMTINYLTASLHYFLLLLIGLYTLLGIVENAAKTGIPLFVKIAELLRIKIKTVEDKITADE